MLTDINNENAKADLRKLVKVQGNSFRFILFFIKTLKKNGINICDMITTQTIPTIEITAMDLKAGCLAKIKTPNPAIVVMADKRIEDLKEEIFFLPVLYSCNKPSMIKRL